MKRSFAFILTLSSINGSVFAMGHEMQRQGVYHPPMPPAHHVNPYNAPHNAYRPAPAYNHTYSHSYHSYERHSSTYVSGPRVVNNNVVVRQPYYYDHHDHYNAYDVNPWLVGALAVSVVGNVVQYSNAHSQPQVVYAQPQYQYAYARNYSDYQEPVYTQTTKKKASTATTTSKKKTSGSSKTNTDNKTTSQVTPVNITVNTTVYPANTSSSNSDLSQIIPYLPSNTNTRA